MRHCKLFILHLVKRQTFVENYFLRCILESFILRCKNWPCLRLFYARFKLRHENQFKFEANKKSHNNLHKFDIRCWFFHVTANVGFFCEICMPTFLCFCWMWAKKSNQGWRIPIDYNLKSRRWRCCFKIHHFLINHPH